VRTPTRLVATLVAATSAVACTGGDAARAASPRPGDTLRVGVLALPVRLRATLPPVALALETHNATRRPGSAPLGLVVPRDGEERLDALARWQRDPQVVAVIGADGAEPTLAAASLLRGEVEAGGEPTPLVTVSASARLVTGITPWLFRLAPRVDALARAVLVTARDSMRARTVAVAHSADVVGREALGTMVGLQDSLGMRLVATVAYDEALHDLALAARQVHAARPDLLVVLSGDVALTARLLRAVRRLDPRLPVLGGPASGGLAEWGDEFAGVTWIGDAAAGTVDPAFLTRLARRAPDSTRRAPLVSAFAARAHDAARLVALAIARTGGDRARIRDVVAAGLPGGTPGLVTDGTIRFEAGNDGAIPLRAFRIAAREARP
jgi:ABC-type branched-subunit amino acid transport system substrate-binding protein